MRQRPLGRTGRTVSELGLGTWGLSGDAYGAVSEAEAERTIAFALDIGISVVETADAYGAGRMEALLGKLCANRSELVVVTKGGIDRATAPPQRRFSESYLREAIGRSLKRLKREAIDIYLLNHPGEDTMQHGGLADTMKKFVGEGLVRHWGVSTSTAEVAQFAMDQGAHVVEVHYNLLAPRLLHRIAGDVLVSRAGVLTRSPLAYGALSGEWHVGREFEEGDHRKTRFTPELLSQRLDQIESLRFLVKGDVPSLRGAAIRFALANHVVSSAILGPKNQEQLKSLVRDTGAGPRYLAEDDIREAFRILERAGVEI